MTYWQAINLLDEQKAGANHPEIVITKALELTGDLTELSDSELMMIYE